MSSPQIEDDKDLNSEDQNEVSEVDPIPSDYVSKPIRSEDCTISDNILNFQHSYGYECKRKFNICVIGGDTVIFIAGNIMTFININTKKVSFRRSALGGGLGYICANSKTTHFAVGEKGFFPPIIVYNWPTLEVVAVLRNGTKKAYTYLDYSQDGKLLCSQGNEPDFFITIWDWEKELIILQCKSYGQEVTKCIFSHYNSDVLVSAGNGHIKFWKIVETFTGLKLEGEIGIFDKTEATDIIALLLMPDGMVLSGSDWGNMLLWNGNVIKYEISKRIPKTCHNAAITAIYYDETSDRLLTLGMDGFVKLWAFGPIQKTDISEDMHTVGCLPIEEYEMKNSSAAFLSSEKRLPGDIADESWIVQDAKGAIWKMNLSMKNECSVEDCLLRAPAGKIVGISCSPSGNLFAVLSEEGGLYVYDYILKKLLGYQIFQDKGTAMLWIPLKVDMRGNKIVVAFESGIIRLVSLIFMKDTQRASDELGAMPFSSEESHKLMHIYKTVGLKTAENEENEYELSSEDSLMFHEKKGKKKSFWIQHTAKGSSTRSHHTKLLDKDFDASLKTEFGEIKFELFQVFKPHTEPISVISHNKNCNIFISGSHDCTIFLFGILREETSLKLIPIGFVRTITRVTSVDWKPHTRPDTALVCCTQGNIMEIELPVKELKATTSSYELNAKQRSMVFQSVKSQILRDIYLEQKKTEKEEKRARKQKELDAMIEEQGKLDFDPETYLADSEEEEELEPLYIPEIPNPILFGYYTDLGNIRLSVGGYDAGYLYEYKFNSPIPPTWIPLEGATDCEAHSYIFSHDRKYLILGMGNGRIRVIRLKPRNTADFSDYWELPMHDSTNGAVKKLCFSIDGKILFSCGNDGNIFSYKFNDSEERRTSESMISTLLYRKSSLPITAKDITHTELYPSLEEHRQKIERETQMKFANSQKETVRSFIKKLQNRFEEIVKRNESLPKSQQYTHEDFQLHPELTNIIIKTINEQRDLLHRKYAWNLEKAKLRYEKLFKVYIDCLDSLTPAISSFRSNIQVEGYRMKKVTNEFYDAQKAVLIKIEQQAKKCMLQDGGLTIQKVVPRLTVPVATFEVIMSAFIPPGTIDFSKMNHRIIRTMDTYVKHKQKLDKRISEWDALTNSKPSENKNDPVDMKAIEDAKQTLGDYKLKTNPNYKVSPQLRETTTKKYKQLLDIYYKIHSKKISYNEKIHKLDEQKRALNIYLEKLLSDLNQSKKRLGENYVDNKMEIFKKILENSKQGTKDSNSPIDLSNKYRRIEKMKAERIDWVFDLGTPNTSSIFSLSKEVLQGATETDMMQTPWEIELSSAMMNRDLYNLEVTCKEVEAEIASFDMNVATLRNTKSELDIQLRYLEHFLLTLQEELLIIKKFESKEEVLTEKVQEKLREKNQLFENIRKLEDELQGKAALINELLENQKEINTNFFSAIENQSTALILRKIFKKKYKPLKVRTEDDTSDEESSSSESSSGSSDDEEGDDDFALPPKIDENVCPEGCSAELFELVLRLRSKRHTIERSLIEDRKVMEFLRKDIDVNKKKLKIIDNAYQKNEEDLSQFQREKQSKLNNLDVVVVISMSQMQQMVSSSDLGAISENILFSKKKLASLNSRAKELEEETDQQVKKHRNLRKHLNRLKVDCKYMRAKISYLRDEINIQMEKKFGKAVNIMKLEQALLRKYVAEVKSHAQELKDLFEKARNEFQEHLKAKQNKLTEILAANTEKMSLLAALQEEKIKLDQILKQQSKHHELAAGEKLDLYQSDIAKLLKIKKRQQKEKEALEDEIMRLSRKTKLKSFLPPIEPTEPQSPTNKETFSTERAFYEAKRYNSTDSSEGV